MTDHLHTGPTDRPRRYRVPLDAGRPVPEPGGGVDGMVYRAVVDDPDAPDHGDVVALKLLLTVAPQDIDVLDKRLEPLRTLDDPRVMRVRGSFVGTALTDDDRPEPDDFDVCYVVADWVEGRRLSDVSPTPDGSLRWASEIARAVALLHRIDAPEAPAGMLHRDLKTTNVRLRADGTPVLVDYGLARPDHEDASVVGTPGWLAPEVAAGRAGGKPADVYGVGAIAHDLLTGTPPRRDGAVLAARRVGDSLRPFPLADEIGRHIGALLALDPDDRPTDLERWADHLDLLASGKDPGRRRRLTARLVGAGALALLAIVGIWLAVAATEPTGTSASGTKNSAATTTSVTATSTAPRSTWDCNREPALPEGAAGDLIRGAYRPSNDTCVGAVDTFEAATVLTLLDVEGEPVSVILATADTPAVRLTSAQYASYREIAGRSSSANTANYGGYPTSVRADDATGYDIIELSSGGVIAGPHAGAQSFWVPRQVRALWESRGGLTGDLGAPTSPVQLTGPTLRLEFERGYMEVEAKAGLAGTAEWLPFSFEDVTVTLVDPAAELAKLGDVADRVIRQSNGSSWYVDEDLVRHWIPDAPTWGCVQANDKVLPVNVPGYAVAALKLGDRAWCETK